MESYDDKYSFLGEGLPLKKVQHFSKQIIEVTLQNLLLTFHFRTFVNITLLFQALLFLKEMGYPWHGHLHTGNIYVNEDDVTCCVGGHENTLIEFPSKFLSLYSVRSDLETKVLDVLCFGMLYFAT